MIRAGIDLIEIERVEHALARFGERFLNRIYTPAEVTLCRGRVPELAARFAGKEAISKALGTGLVGISWREMEILSDARGKPVVHLYGHAWQRAAELGLGEFEISLSHTRDYALAMVVSQNERDGSGAENQATRE